MPSVEQKVGHFLTHKVRRRNHLTPKSLSYGPGPGPSSGAKRSAAEEAAEPRKEKMGLGGRRKQTGQHNRKSETLASNNLLLFLPMATRRSFGH